MPRVKYLLLIYGNKEKWESYPQEELDRLVGEMEEYNAKYRATGELLGSYGLSDRDEARLVRSDGGMPVVTDGPYLETKEYLASFWLLDCESLERAYEIAADMPGTEDEPVELWPVPHESAHN
jgi:hypothetical protein